MVIKNNITPKGKLYFNINTNEYETDYKYRGVRDIYNPKYILPDLIIDVHMWDHDSILNEYKVIEDGTRITIRCNIYNSEFYQEEKTVEKKLKAYNLTLKDVILVDKYLPATIYNRIYDYTKYIETNSLEASYTSKDYKPLTKIFLKDSLDINKDKEISFKDALEFIEKNNVYITVEDSTTSYFEKYKEKYTQDQYKSFVNAVVRAIKIASEIEDEFK